MKLRALGALIAAGGILVVLGAAPGPETTDAAFTDAEQTVASPIGAVAIRPPQITQIQKCVRPVLGLSSVLEVRWTWPAQTAPYPQLAASSASWSLNGGPGQSVATTGPVNGVYTTAFTGNLLGDLLGGLLGQSYTVDVRTRWTTPGGAVWTSSAASRIDVQVPLLLGSPTCTPTNG